MIHTTFQRAQLLSLLVVAIAGATSCSFARAGEIDPSQQKWFKFYKGQQNAPDPAEMLLNTEAEPELIEGFTPLFNGKDLAGWTSYGGKSKFDVQDGCIRGVCVPGTPSTYLCTDRSDYSDFIFTCDIKLVKDINTGVMFRGFFKGKNNNTVAGPQCEFETKAKIREWSGGIYGQSDGGWFYPLWLKDHAAARGAQVHDEWNRITIYAKGDTVKTWLNGTPIAHWKTDKYPQGYFGLQVHRALSGEVLWRNLKVKELKD